ncbi:MAG: hypothetical protein R3C09_11840 [Pirellulaceae bacterium]|jgi:hypothetical protein
MNEYQPFDADNRLVIIEECRSSQTIYIDSEESFNAEAEQAADVQGELVNGCGSGDHRVCQPTVAACAGDGTCGCQLIISPAAAYHILGSSG